MNDRYRIQRELGQGGMAVVYLAIDLQQNRAVALKVLRPEIVGLIGVERFLREIEIAGSLSHPHIVPLFDAGKADGLPYYVMPFVEGESLRDRLRRDARLPVDEALQITREVADALAYAHALGIIHRDIKPENILLSRGHALLADFGIARALSAAGVQDKLTGSGTAIGTVDYMSPEQALGGAGVDARTDQYGLACVLYEMLAGAPPFFAPTPQAVLAKQLIDPVPPLRTVRDTVPAPLEAAIIRALSKSNVDRFPTVGAFVEALEAKRVAPPSRRRVAVWAIGTVAATLALGVAVQALRKSGGLAGVPAEESVVVLPFVNTSGTKEDDYLSDGITDELSSALVAVEGLRVAPKSSARSLKGAIDSRVAGTRLRVGNVIEGSLARRGTRLHLTAQLIRASDGKTLWSSSFDPNADSIFNVRLDVVPGIVAALGLKLASKGDEEAMLSGTESAEAHDLYLKGRFYWNQRNATSTLQAIPFFEQAIQKDSLYARAYAGLSDSYSYLAMFGGAHPASVVKKAEETASRAIALDPQLPEAVTSVGLFHLTFDWDWKAVGEALSKATRLAPRSAQARLYYAFYLLAIGKNIDALQETKYAEELEPFFQVAPVRVGEFYYFNHQYDLAIRQLRKTLEFDSTYRLAQGSIAFAFSQVGQHDSAIAWASKMAHAPRSYGAFTSALGTAYALAGRRSDALAVIDDFRQQAKQHDVIPLSYAMIYAALGDRDSAFVWLDRSYVNRDWWLTLLRAEPIFDPLHSDPRWDALVRRMKFP